jgi:hypothetical protein
LKSCGTIEVGGSRFQGAFLLGRWTGVITYSLHMLRVLLRLPQLLPTRPLRRRRLLYTTMDPASPLPHVLLRPELKLCRGRARFLGSRNCDGRPEMEKRMADIIVQVLGRGI